MKLSTTPLAADRPSYWGTLEQIADDLETTRAAGAHEVILDLQSDAGTAAELMDLAAAVLAAGDLAVAA